MNYLKFIPQYGLFVLLLSLFSFTLLKDRNTTLEIVTKHDTSLYSAHLHRNIVLDILLPPDYNYSNKSYKVLYMNDGQDLQRLQMTKLLTQLFENAQLPPFVLVAIHCGDRMQEYGTAAQADYKQRGAKATAYTAFITEELMPHIEKKYPVLMGASNTVFCGFSLGGLSAFDIVWHYPHLFGKVGVFSGSFWWRQRAYEDHYDDENDRIMHRLVRQSAGGSGQSSIDTSYSELITRNSPLGTHHSELNFWFQTGTEDEKDDRNNNGVIDSIEDTLDLIAELEKKGYRWGKEIRYVEVENGQHDPTTWSSVMPDFLTWAFGTK
ncbi:MAG: alpha/beta hydrolase-fold protein [Spirosomataceae bacterium]